MSDDEDDERLKNLALYHFWGTDKELEEDGPMIFGVALIVVIALILLKVFNVF